MIYGNWPLAAMVIINLPRHLWKRPTAGVYIYCVAVGSYCLSATQWVEPFRLNQRLCPPLKPLSAAQCQVCSSLFVVLSLLNTSLHHLSHPRTHSAALFSAVSLSPAAVLTGGWKYGGMKGREMGCMVGWGHRRTEMAFPLLPWFGLTFVRLAGSSKQAYQRMLWSALLRCS